MFHLSLPVTAFAACLDFYRTCFGADVVMLGERSANIFAFGGQITLHDRPETEWNDAQRREMHFGQVVPEREWFALRDRLLATGYPVMTAIEPKDSPSGRGKLLIADPSGNLIEINSALPGR